MVSGSSGVSARKAAAPVKAEAGGILPERLIALDVGEQHLRNPLHIVEGVERAAADVAERVVAGCSSLRVQRIEQKHALPGERPGASRRRIVFFLHVEADERCLVEQRIWDHEADALARTGGRVAGDVFRSAET